MSDRIRPSDLPYKGDRPMGVGFCKDNNGNMIWDGGDSFSGIITFPDLASFQAAGGASAYPDMTVWIGGAQYWSDGNGIEKNGFTHSIFYGDKTSTSSATNQTEAIAEGAKKIEVANNESIIHYVGLGHDSTSAAQAVTSGTAGRTRFLIPPKTSQIIRTVGYSHIAWASSGATGVLTISHGV